MLKKWFKTKHNHEWTLVACNDEYSTIYSDTNKTVNWQPRFYQCECGARKHTDNRPEYSSSHKGIDEAKQNWIDLGVVPGKSYVPGSAQGYYKITDQERKELDPVLAYQQTLKDMVDSLGVIIKRDFKLEEKYPDLREIAERYHQVLDQYRVIEILKSKEENN